MADKPPATTTGSGNPIADNQHSLTVGPRGPVSMRDFAPIGEMAHFNR